MLTPNSKTIVLYSMGICSAYIAARLQDECQSPICIFNDTGQEDADTYRFGREVQERWGLNVVDISAGETLFEWFRRNNTIPARQIPACSKALKIKPTQEFLSSFPGPARVAYGYDTDEEDRLERTQARWPYPALTPYAPLQEWGISKEQCFGYFSDHGIKPPRVYQYMSHANCTPCKNWREKDWQAARHFLPEVYEKSRAFEEETGLRFMQDGPRLIDLPLLLAPPTRKGRRALAGDSPAFSFDAGCDACRRD